MMKTLRGLVAAVMLAPATACTEPMMNVNNDVTAYVFDSCTSYGFQPRTEQHANCVMTVMQSEQVRRASAQQSTSSAVIGAVGTVLAGVVSAVFLFLR